MTKIIGHRGAKGQELENSLDSIHAALALGVDAIEFDVHLTKDRHLVVIHDNTTRRIANKNLRVRHASLKDLQSLHMKNGQQIPTFEEVLNIAGSQPIYIDMKDEGCAAAIVKVLERFSIVQATFLSYRPSELEKIRRMLPQAKTILYYLKAKTIVPRPFNMVRTAERIGASAIEVDKLFMNPLFYHLARKAKLDIYVYSVSSVRYARQLKRLYPDVNFTTGNPEAFVKAFKHQL
jgi:glycerophosphoryl diester phosphodiesterase